MCPKPGGDGFLLHKKWICGSLWEDRWLNKTQRVKIEMRLFLGIEQSVFYDNFSRKIEDKSENERLVPFQNSYNNVDKSA